MGLGRAAALAVQATSLEPAKIGFIGFGEMGARMVKNLLSSEAQDVVVCDERAEALRRAEDLGAEIASSPASLASTEGVQVVISMLSTSNAVRDVYLGSRGIIQASEGIRPTLLIDCSTVDPAVSHEITREMGGASLHQSSRPFPGCSSAHPAVIDAPVSGGITAAAAGSLTFMVGGHQDAVKAAEPYLKMLGQNIFHCGSTGTGQIAKVANNLACGIQMASVAEAMSFGISKGIDPQTLAQIFNLSSSRCWSSVDYNPVPGIMEGVPASRGYKGGFAMSHMIKDLKIALLASKQGSSSKLPMTTEALKLYQQVASENPNLDFGAIYEYVYRQSTTSL